MVGDEDRRALLDPLRDPLRARLRLVLPLLLPVLPKLTGQRDKWAEWLVETRFAAMSPEERDEALVSLAAVRDRVLDRARIGVDDVVIDVGTGTGLLAVGALDRLGPAGSVIALDVSVDCLDELRAMCDDPRVSYLVGGAEVLPLPDESVDVAMTRSVLVYVRDKAEAARELFRVLKPGGRVSLFEPVNRRCTRLWEVVEFGDLADRVVEDFHRRWPPDHPLHDFDPEDMEGWFSEAGFEDVGFEVDAPPQVVRPDTVLYGVGSPGSPRLVDAWRTSFTEEEIERLVAAVRAAGETLTVYWPGLYLGGRKP